MQLDRKFYIISSEVGIMFYVTSSSIICGSNQCRLVLCLFILSSLIMIVQAEKIAICKDGCDYTTINEGIVAAKPGDTIEVHGGIYRENINITKSLKLLGLGAGMDIPVVDAGQTGSAITLSADNIEVQGFMVRSAVGHFLREWAGIKVISSNNIISNIVAENNDNGLLLKLSRNNIILNNNITRNQKGIMLEASQNNTIENNSLKSSIYGIYLLSSKGNRLISNQVSDHDHGIMLGSSAHNILRNNLMDGNTDNFGAEGSNDIDKSNLVNGKPIYYLSGQNGYVIDSTSNAGTIYCDNCSDIRISDLILKNNSNGIVLRNTTDSIIENNTLSDNSFGIWIEHSMRNFFRNNAVCNNHIHGLNVNYSQNNTFENNSIVGNYNYGMIMESSMYNYLVNNDFTQNRCGLGLNQSNDNSIVGNNFKINMVNGILVFNSNQNNLSENRLYDNPKGLWMIISLSNWVEKNFISDNLEGVRMEFSSNNTISNNSLIFNMRGVLFDPSYKNQIANNNFSQNKLNTSELVSSTTSWPPGGNINMDELIKTKSVGLNKSL